MRLACTVSFALSLLSTALADVEFTNPTAGTVIRAGDVVTTHWRDSGALPRLTELVQYDIYLCAGGDSPESHVVVLNTLATMQEDVALLIKNAAFSRGNSVSFRIDPDVGGNDENAYFLRIVASGPEASVVNYSDRFTLTNMTGSFSPLIVHGIHSAIHASGSPVNEGEEHEELRKRQMVGSYTIPYPLQTGPTRYAPMAKKPGSTIPAGSPTPQFSASPYTIATTYLPAATVQVTLSASETYSVVSIENTASPAPRSQDVQMKRFLERWKD
ncbi:beta-1,6-glucan biosynthesis protein [Aspergillus sclerotiicarbonarius CBS 121057]|uniref:Beta-1,6-glucan biosynthesis protein n=1 Tax=Aspergillus sclerotiicarbonarius (strain CBS 121057 / IBT 28362) TaxID=1448318 RepID=A0A319EQG7_ASPSB|nr:beta-1,6-glucan biosynthesis protein [Aspergillus sclerotiicarbonarius CBS 121057]